MKKIAVFLCFVLAITLSSCGKKNSQEEEMIVNPEYILKDYETSASEDGSLVVNGYHMLESEMPKVTLFYPKVENKKDGVRYIDDMYYNNQNKRRKDFSLTNRPEGTTSLDNVVGYNSIYGFRNFSGNIIPEFAQKYYDSDVPNWISEDRSEGLFGYSGDEDKSTSDTLVDADVGAISVALYEDFYGYSPTMTVKIYGIPNSLIKDEFGKKFGHEKYFEFEDKLKKNSCKSCTYLCEKQINETGVYYIDFEALSEKDEFVSYIISFHIEGINDYYSYLASPVGCYNITDKNDYEQWKKEHSEQLINN